jgi:hypothetical protein
MNSTDDKHFLACTFASLLLYDAHLSITTNNIQNVLTAANISNGTAWPYIVSQFLKEKDIGEVLVHQLDSYMRPVCHDFSSVSYDQMVQYIFSIQIQREIVHCQMNRQNTDVLYYKQRLNECLKELDSSLYHTFKSEMAPILRDEQNCDKKLFDYLNEMVRLKNLYHDNTKTGKEGESDSEEDDEYSMGFYGFY